MTKTQEESTLYAIIKTGGKQYRVEQNDVLDVELLNVEDGTQVEFNEVLFFFDGSVAKVGEPGVAGLVVRGEVLSTVNAEKIDTIKYKPSRNQYRRFGHRQKYSRVKINFIGSSREKKGS